MMSHAATWHPSAASWITSSRPMPVPPPVTTASFPSNDSIALPPDVDVSCAPEPTCGGADPAKETGAARGSGSLDPAEVRRAA